MKIKNIKINNYGKLENKEINLENKINIIYGKNESGKSTLLNYIKNIFYGISKNKNGKDISDFEKYKPWGKEDYSGRLSYELDNGEKFEIYRDFTKKNPKLFNEQLEDVSKDFNIVKKDGIQFFYDQTGVDETMFTSTVVSMQEEVKLDRQDQNVLVQKLANLAGTGEDSLSYQKVMERLNKRQVEEIGTDRSQGRPINLVKERLKKVEFVLKDTQQYQNDKQDIQEQKQKWTDKINMLEDEMTLLKKINIIELCRQPEEDKIAIKKKYNEEKKTKIEELNLEKNNLNKNNKINSEKNNKKINIKKYIFILFLILLINILIFILNKNYLKNNLINIFNYFLIPIYLIIIFIKEKLNKIKINKKNKIENEKIINEINFINKQIELLEEEIRKEEENIKQEEINLDNKIEVELEKLKQEYKNKLNITEYLDKIQENNINFILNNKQEELNKAKIEIASIKMQEENITEKLNNMASLQEENTLLQEELNALETKNDEINLAREFIQKAYIKMKNTITPKFTENLSKNIAIISNNKYTKVGINDEKGLIVENEYGEYIPAERLSIGTIDQLYLALRLSMIEDLSKEAMPILLDEAFAYYDDKRLENVLKFLVENMKNHQVILFTCTRREQEILDKLQLTYNLVEL